MYTGAVRIAAPTPRPPQMRAATNSAKRVENAAAKEEARNNTAVSSSTLLRPKRSLRGPAARLPAIAPQPRQLTAQPSLRLPAEPWRPKYSRMKGTAPDMTVASNPTRKPPSATVAAMRTILNSSPVICTPASRDAPDRLCAGPQGAELCDSYYSPNESGRSFCNRFQECCVHKAAAVKGKVPWRPLEP